MDIRCKRNIFLATCIILIFLLLSWRLRGSNVNLLPQSQRIHLDNSTPPHPPPTTSTSTSTTTTTTQNTTRTLILAKLSEEITLWADELAESDPTFSLAIYTVDIDDPSTNPNLTSLPNFKNYNYTVPANKGHEAMVYLTYIIDHYDDPNLSDISIFMHSHLRTWHNNDFLDSSSATMVSRLRSSHVLKTGYMNLRCHHQPGCPNHIHPRLSDKDDDLKIPESAIIGDSWTELFPERKRLPEVLSQPCCGQFALSKATILSIPREKYIFYRDWLLQTDLEDRLSGRVWEYTWQYIFAGREVFCPDEYECYCQGYGVCFESKAQYERWFEMRREVGRLEREVQNLEDDGEGDGEKQEEGKQSIPEDERERKKIELQQRIEKLRDQMDREKELAVTGGRDGKGW
ncbi:hypothetical protein VTN00DRAFT_5115 [Thermoascus crustaceus]|uniref:uncharacterized protein n=1 Tax=Thermoascus crustaceus TaxID=5088 RepID=UPI0037421727